MKDRYKKILDLLDTEGPHLHRLLTRLTCREDVTGDLLQELVIRLCQSRGLEKAKDPFAYAYRAAANLAFEWRRRQRVDTRRGLEKYDAPAAAPSPIGAVIDSEELERVLDATARLRELARQVVVMHYIEQMSYEEIAHRLGKKPQHIRSVTSKALAQWIHVYADQLDPDTRGGGGNGSLAKFVRYLGQVAFNQQVVDETEGDRDVEINYGWHMSGYVRKITDEKERAQKLRLVLDNVSRQTGLTFTVERRWITVWRIIEDGPPE